LTDRALRDLDGIYQYIAETLIEPAVALNLVDEIEAALLSLYFMPHRCSERRVGAFANQGYRQLFVKNYTALFRTDEEKMLVIVVTVRYSKSQF